MDFILQLVTDPVAFYQTHTVLIAQVGINSILASSMFLVLYSGQLSLAAPGFMAIGAYTAVLMGLYWNTPLAVNILGGTLLVPRSVLAELQSVADSSNPERQARGRRALDLLVDLKRDPSVDLELIEDERASVDEPMGIRSASARARRSRIFEMPTRAIPLRS